MAIIELFSKLELLRHTHPFHDTASPHQSSNNLEQYEKCYVRLEFSQNPASVDYLRVINLRATLFT